MTWFAANHHVVRMRPGPDVTDSYGELIPGPDVEESVSVVAVWLGGSTDESGSHVERVEVDASIIAPTGTFTASDRARIAEFDALLQVVGQPKVWDRTPWGFSPGCELVELKAVTG